MVVNKLVIVSFHLILFLYTFIKILTSRFDKTCFFYSETSMNKLNTKKSSDNDYNNNFDFNALHISITRGTPYLWIVYPHGD